MSGWTQSTGTSGAPAAAWFSVASDSTGTKLVAVISAVSGTTTGIWKSTDSGATWTQSIAPGAAWRIIASSADGTKLVAVINDINDINDTTTTTTTTTGIYTSINSGANWTKSTAPDAYWRSVASDSTGTKLVSVINNTTTTTITTGIYTYKDTTSQPSQPSSETPICVMQ